jgi:hypothetical protein
VYFYIMRIATKIKPKKCRECKNDFLPTRPLQVVCSLSCSISLAKKKQELKEEKDWQKRKKEGKEAIKKLSEYESEARKEFQKWIRMRDIAEPCISCGCTEAKWDAGHWWKAELYSGLIFNEDNVNKQCSRPCNKDYHGNEANYRIGLIKKIGEERVKWLEENKDRLRSYSWTKEELIEIKNTYKQKLKEL